MSTVETISQQLYNFLLGRNFEPSTLDTSGKEVLSPVSASIISFDYKTENKDYGTVVISITSDSIELYFSDNLGRGMETSDKSAWYDFLYAVRMLAKRNMYKFSLTNMNKLKYNMKTMAAVNEGYHGTRKTSYNGKAGNTRIIIKHSKQLGEEDARFRNIHSIFVETADGERFKLPFNSISGAKAMAQHVRNGGTPYDAFGQHISECINEIATLGRFVRATRNKTISEQASDLTERALAHYNHLKRKVKRLIGKRGYNEEFANFEPTTNTAESVTADEVRSAFIEQTVDSRIDEALPLLARLAAKAVASKVASKVVDVMTTDSDVEESASMKELDEFEAWADNLLNGTDSEIVAEDDIDIDVDGIKSLLATPLLVGADAVNASELLYDLVSDRELMDRLAELAQSNPDADARQVIVDRLRELGVSGLPSINIKESIDIRKLLYLK